MNTKTPNNQTPSGMRYPTIEKLVESEDFTKVNETMTASYELLERMLTENSGGMKKQSQIRQALKAYDLTMDLIKALLKTKYEMVKKQKESSLKQSPQKK